VRVLLFTGKGGVGKTTAAAATAVTAAARGLKTLVMSTDPAHSLADAFGVPLGADPTEIDTGLAGMQIDAQSSFERSWRQVQAYLMQVLAKAGVDPIEAEELTVLPGADEVLALLAVREQVECGRWDLVVVDCAPTAETLRLLALPDALDWYMRRLWPIERRVVRSLRPVLNRVAGVPMPNDAVFDAVERLHTELAGVRAVLADPERTSVRLVLTPEAVVVAEARRTMTTLSLYGYRVDAVVANRIFPGGDPWRDAWAEAQQAQLQAVEESFSPLPLLRVGYQPGEPVGVQALSALGQEVYGELDPLGMPAVPDPISVQRTVDGFALTVLLPFADKDEIGLTRRGDELAITFGSWRRLLALPSALRRCRVTGARMTDGRLDVTFEPDPDLWMKT
jgi:arsenite/tail-anchored protein-transporting ATPase